MEALEQQLGFPSISLVDYAVPPADGTIFLDSPSAVAGRYARIVKPALDRMVVVVALILALPFMLVIAFAIRVSLGPGIIFRQERVGRGGRPFTIYKFRTMRHDCRKGDLPYDGPDRRTCHKSPDDPRHTPVGRALRKIHMDELPQLVNVLKGDMSLVGPRPELLSVVNAHYQPWQLERHLVKPGITGPWQVGEQRSCLIYENVAPDLRYIRNVSFATDASIIFRTVPALLGRGQ